MTTVTHEIYYAVCDCHIWPLVRYAGVGRCGRCRTRPEGSFQSKEDAFNWYFALHGTVPPKMSA